MTTNVPSTEFTPTGLVQPTQAEILSGVEDDINAAFDNKLNMALNTPQGQLASSTAAIISDSNDAFAEFVDQVDPDNATGFMQDAIARIYFLTRNPALSTVVQVVCIGEAGVTIPVGAQVEDTSGNIYVCTQQGTFDPSGTMTLPFANQQTGPIPCPANTVTEIYQSIAGWDSVNNPSDGIVGTNVETQQAFEFRRQNTVAANAHGSLQSIYGAVFEVDGVIDAYAIENFTDSPIVVGSTDFTLVPHSFLIAVVGGAAQDIADAIWTKKNEGSNMNGNTTETVTDDSFAFPQPTYTITFNNNAENPVTYDLTITIVNNSALPANIVALVQAACLAQFNGTNSNGQRVRIGSLFLAAQFYGPVANAAGAGVPVQVIDIGIGDAFTGTGTIVLGSDVLTVATAVANTLGAGTPISMTDISAGTYIVQQLTGTPGGMGTYQMSTTAGATHASPIAVTGSATGTSALVGVDQAPELGTVTVNLI